MLRTLILIIKSYCIELSWQQNILSIGTIRRMLFSKLKLNSLKQRCSRTNWSFNFAGFVKRSVWHVLNKTYWKCGKLSNTSQCTHARLPYFHRIHWKQKMQILTDLQRERTVCRFFETPNKKGKRKERKDYIHVSILKFVASASCDHFTQHN